MFLRNYIALACAVLSASAFAQSAQLGTVAKVSGAVTVSNETSAGAASVGTPIFDGSHVVTGANGSAILSMSGGCSVTIAPSRSLTVMKNMPCEALNASAHPTSNSGGTGGNGGGGTSGSGRIRLR